MIRREFVTHRCVAIARGSVMERGVIDAARVNASAKT
jgi:hypothetical protein